MIPKFRAWHKEDKCYYVVRQIRFDTEYISLWIGYTVHHMSLENVILEQYTGLIDRNGKEIYEGDILTVTGNNLINITKCVSSINEFIKEFGRENYMYFKVIGNIHENKELLK